MSMGEPHQYAPYKKVEPFTPMMVPHLTPEPYAVPSVPPAELASRARELFLRRVGGIRAELSVSAANFIACHVYADMVYLFYCFDGREGSIKESMDMFPTDQLVAQFRLLLNI